jgi:hypothetical protein
MFTPSSRASSSARVVFPNPGWPKEKRVIERFPPRQRGVHGDSQVLLDTFLADELGQSLRPQSEFNRSFLGQFVRSRDLSAHAGFGRRWG